jgi:hypothetical protein
MSYELRLVHAGHRWDKPEEEELNPGPMVAAKEEEKRRLAGALMRLNPVLCVAAFDYPSLAAAENVDPEEARRRYRHIELNSDDYSGIQITLWDDEVELTFPYWHSGEQARNVLRQVWEYLELLQMWGSFVSYDPQLGRVLNLAADFDAVLEYLAAGADSTYERAARAVK